jgi:hypothetical protein
VRLDQSVGKHITQRKRIEGKRVKLGVEENRDRWLPRLESGTGWYVCTEQWYFCT